MDTDICHFSSKFLVAFQMNSTHKKVVASLKFEDSHFPVVTHYPFINAYIFF